MKPSSDFLTFHGIIFILYVFSFVPPGYTQALAIPIDLPPDLFSPVDLSSAPISASLVENKIPSAKKTVPTPSNAKKNSSPSPTPTPTGTPTASPTETPSPAVPPAPAQTPTPAIYPTATPTPTVTPPPPPRKHRFRRPDPPSRHGFGTKKRFWSAKQPFKHFMTPACG